MIIRWLPFFLKSIEKLIIKLTKLFVLITNNFSQIIKLKAFSRRHDNISAEICILQCSKHNIDFSLWHVLFFKNDGITDTFHAIFKEVLVTVSILVHVKVLCSNFSNHKIYIEESSKSFRLFQIKYSFFQMVVTWKRSNNNLRVFRLFIGIFKINHCFDKCFTRELNILLNSCHLKTSGWNILHFNLFWHIISQSSFPRARNSGNYNNICFSSIN